MDGVLKRVEDLEDAINVIAAIMRDMGGDGVGDNVANASITLRDGGFHFSLYARDGWIVIDSRDDGSSLSFERRPTDV